MNELLTNEAFLASCAGKRVSIYTRVGESYGIRSYCDAFQAFLQEAGIDARIRNVGAFGLLRDVLADRREGNLSVFATWHGLAGWLNPEGSLYVLHGFPVRDYSMAQFMVLWGVCRLSSRMAKRVIANSSLTHVLNSKIFSTEADYIWNPLRAGVLDESLQAGLPDLGQRSRKIAFVGRAIPGKHAFEAAEAFAQSSALTAWEMLIIGGLEDRRIEILSASQPRLRCLGQVSRERVQQELQDVRVLVSLNPLEPYGFVYQEAAAAGTVIVAPWLAGATEDLRKLYGSRLVLVLDYSKASLAEALERAAHLAEPSLPRLSSVG